jgi:hypothetical protein
VQQTMPLAPILQLQNAFAAQMLSLFPSSFASAVRPMPTFRQHPDTMAPYVAPEGFKTNFLALTLASSTGATGPQTVNYQVPGSPPLLRPPLKMASTATMHKPPTIWRLSRRCSQLPTQFARRLLPMLCSHLP